VSEEDEGMRASALIVVWLVCAALGWGCVALLWQLARLVGYLVASAWRLL
jgi:hypothetical protein